MVDSIDSPYIHAAGDENFHALVLENSQKGPVLVNFWSKKAAPCLRQYPILDKLVHQYKGRLLLINVDTDREIKLSSDYSVASVPTLKLFSKGKPAETLHGYQPESDLTRLLNQYVARDSDQVLAEAVGHYAQGRRDHAYAVLTHAVMEDPENPRLPIAMCKMLIHEQRYGEAGNLLAAIPENIKTEEADKLQIQLDFASILDKTDDRISLQKQVQSAPNELAARKKLAALCVLQKDYENAFKQLIAIMDVDRFYDDHFARHSCLKLFKILGQDHPMVSRLRPELLRYSH